MSSFCTFKKSDSGIFGRFTPLKVVQVTVNQNATIYTKNELENGSIFLNLQIVSDYECINYCPLQLYKY